jgi:hypothetical protein
MDPGLIEGIPSTGMIKLPNLHHVTDHKDHVLQECIPARKTNFPNVIIFCTDVCDIVDGNCCEMCLAEMLLPRLASSLLIPAKQTSYLTRRCSECFGRRAKYQRYVGYIVNILFVF